MESKIKSFHPNTDEVFYEVEDKEGYAIWGGINPHTAIVFWRKYLDAKIMVSTWVGEGEDIHPTGIPIDLTPILRAMASEVVNV